MASILFEFPKGDFAHLLEECVAKSRKYANYPHGSYEKLTWESGASRLPEIAALHPELPPEALGFIVGDAVEEAYRRFLGGCGVSCPGRDRGIYEKARRGPDFVLGCGTRLEIKGSMKRVCLVKTHDPIDFDVVGAGRYVGPGLVELGGFSAAPPPIRCVAPGMEVVAGWRIEQGGGDWRNYVKDFDDLSFGALGS